jgi:hypothetical protein
MIKLSALCFYYIDQQNALFVNKGVTLMIPYKELDRRIKNCRQAMQKNDLAGALLVQRADLFYFSGTGQNAHLFVPAEGEAGIDSQKINSPG